MVVVEMVVFLLWLKFEIDARAGSKLGVAQSYLRELIATAINDTSSRRPYEAHSSQR